MPDLIESRNKDTWQSFWMELFRQYDQVSNEFSLDWTEEDEATLLGRLIKGVLN